MIFEEKKVIRTTKKFKKKILIAKVGQPLPELSNEALVKSFFFIHDFVPRPTAVAVAAKNCR